MIESLERPSPNGEELGELLVEEGGSRPLSGDSREQAIEARRQAGDPGHAGGGDANDGEDSALGASVAAAQRQGEGARVPGALLLDGAHALNQRRRSRRA